MTKKNFFTKSEKNINILRDSIFDFKKILKITNLEGNSQEKNSNLPKSMLNKVFLLSSILSLKIREVVAFLSVKVI